MKRNIHFWDFPKEMYILLSKKLRREIIEKALIATNSKSNYELSIVINNLSIKHNMHRKFNGGDINRWIKGEYTDKRTNKTHPKFMPLWLVLELSDITKTKLNMIENQVIGYKSGLRGNIIKNPKLPIIVNPEFDSIILHIFGDGYANNETTTPSYCQKKSDDRELFIKKLVNIFGNFEGDLKNGKNFRFPKAITRILSKHYNIKSYMGNKAEIPKEIFNKNKYHKLACIVAFILDEGNIRDIICCFNTNKKLLSQIIKLFEEMGYGCNPLRFGSNRYWFSMKNMYINKFYRDVIKLEEKYPTCSLGTKFSKLKDLYLKNGKNRL